MLTAKRSLGPVLICLGLLLLPTSSLLAGPQGHLANGFQPPAQSPTQARQYVLLGWNDLGMHCYNRDFSDLAVLPPYNTLWAQVVKVGDPPQIVTQGVRVEYGFPENTYSVGKSNFWSRDAQGRQYAQLLFGLAQPLPDNTGLTGRTLSGTMDPKLDHFEAAGIPLTEYRDADATGPNPSQWPRYPYQKAVLIARDATTGAVLAQNTVVAPVSTEMHCEYCHSDGQREGIATGKVETNILAYHDREQSTNLMAGRPVLCASCHSSNALGTPPQPGILSLSNAMHRKHSDPETGMPNTTDGCYNCHPGPSTRCLRDVMSEKHGFSCQTCHGPLTNVMLNPDPWRNEPRCDNAGCHGSNYAQDQPLYRNSSGHDGIRCEACHDSTHAIAASRESNDAIKFVNLQGYAGTLNRCSVCHTTSMAGRIHPTALFLPPRGYLPNVTR